MEFPESSKTLFTEKMDNNHTRRKKFRVSDLSDNNSSDEQFQRNENVCPRFSPSETTRTSRELNDTLTRDSRQSMRKKWKTQSTLLKAGFQRKRDDIDQSSNSGSDTEFVRKDYSKKLTLSRKNSSENKRHPSGENFSYNSNGIHNDGFNIVQSMNPSIMQTMNVIQPINIVQSKNGRSVQTQILPPAAVKVQVEDKVLMISLKLDTINRLTISWLVEENSRLASPTGRHHPLRRDTWSVATPWEFVSSKTLTSTQIRPLFRALTHQTHITAVIISDNNLGDSGVKYLAECICTMKHLTHLDISRNNITHDGTKFILNLFENSKRPVCQSLEELDISSNPIGDNGFKNITKICEYVRLKVLKMNYCSITDHALTDNKQLNFDSIESIDMSNNDVKQPVVSCLMTSLNPNVVVDLELDNVGVGGNVVGCVASFLDSAKEKLLQRQPPVPAINLQGCQDIFKYSPDSDFQVWLPAIDFGRCIPEINVTPVSKTDQERNSFKMFSKTWLNCFKGRGVIEHCEGGVIKFTAR
ncbi:NF-kappa-B inhibitor-like protein 2 [Operophtera brumata]|uniref:NF-kappa-B inhibitor-like protein 2 n=1 Tax=Operophtera brumata TaxID=104452 RepID=A0A0L7LA29_OPEBR|nr:NF-kappa-B inhibitor-like protein 2 [Operophtera brumata]